MCELYIEQIIKKSGKDRWKAQAFQLGSIYYIQHVHIYISKGGQKGCIVQAEDSRQKRPNTSLDSRSSELLGRANNRSSQFACLFRFYVIQQPLLCSLYYHSLIQIVCVLHCLIYQLQTHVKHCNILLLWFMHTIGFCIDS